jgi:dynein heavy chain
MSKEINGYKPTHVHKWIVLDGDIDATWIESMNTVMDDNKVLTLVSNERVPLSDAMRMVFEINSLANATPATVSRAGILFINEADIGWQPFVDSWIAKSNRTPSEQANLPGLFTKYIDSVYNTMRKATSDVVPVRVINKVMTVCYMMDKMLDDLKAEVESQENPEKISPEDMESLFVFACVWAFGGALVTEDREKFDDIWRSTFKSIKFPKEPKGATVFDFYWDYKTRDHVHWSQRVEPWMPALIGTQAGATPFYEISVDTVSSTRLRWLVDTLVSQKRPVLFVGTAGTGKTTVMNSYLSTLPENKSSCTINMNFYLNAKTLQLQMEGAIDKRSGSIFGPPAGKTLLYFCDDLNLPYVEEYGTQNSLALLRQLIDHRQVYDRHDLGFCKTLVDVQYLASMNPTAGSFTVNERVQRHFATFACSMPCEAELIQIYSAILEGHLATGASEVVQNLVGAMSEATVALHQKVTQKFMPSAIKFVYNWNMREISNVFQGVTRIRTDDPVYESPVTFIRLWLHECNRVFGDRLITTTDQTRFKDHLMTCAKKHFDLEDDDALEETADNPIIFTTFHKPSSDGILSYLPVTSMEKLEGKMNSQLEMYNESHTIMDLVLFQQAILHVTRIVRIIQNPKGNAMLVGVGGSGKQSLTRLAAHICEYKCKQISVTGTYGLEDFQENLRSYYRMAGVLNQPFVFLMTDGQIVNDKFLVCINEILTSGWISDLFPREDQDALLNSVRKAAKAAGVPDTPESNLEFLVQRIQRNMHIVLCFSPVGDLFRLRARRFPGLINSTCIDWFHPWPREALVKVAQKYLEPVELNSPETKENVAYHMAEVHLTVMQSAILYSQQQKRHVHVTPKSFLELIDFYVSLLKTKRTTVNGLVDRLSTGLATLIKTADDVAELQNDLKLTMVKVAEKKEATDKLLEQMGQQREEAQKQQEKAAVEKKKADEAAAVAQKIEDEAEAELAQAKPAMERAKAAVDCLDKAALTELKNFPKPPKGAEKVTQACLMMIDGEFRNFKWARAKKMMAKVGQFLEALKAFKAEEMSDKLVEKLTPIVNDPDIAYDVMMKKSEAAANLAAWVINIFGYNRIYVKVKPLMDSLEQARNNKQAALDKLASVKALVAKVENQLAQLQATFLEATQEKARVEADAKACEERLALAQRLITGLSSERERWGTEIETLKVNLVNLTGDALLAAAFVSYIGGFDAKFRSQLWKDAWIPDMEQRDIPITEGVDPFNVILNDGIVAQMMEENLPADRISLENGGIMINCKRWPLVIDPQLQGIKWLKQRYADPKFSLEVQQMNNKNWLRKLKMAIQSGSVLIFENIGEDLDATLDPVLARALTKKGRSHYLLMGDERIEFDMNFKMFLQCKLSNPNFKPELQAQTTLINFIATESGLEDQLLAKVVNAEEPALEKRKQDLQSQFNQYKIKLTELEDELLERLANAPADILSDVPLIEGLEATKKTSMEINEAVKEGKETEVKINESREVYRSVAAEGSMLYFILTRMDTIDHMYQYSLDAFVKFFFKSIEVCEASETVEGRVVNLRESLRRTIYTWVSRGLFERHKLILLCQITFSLMMRGKLDVEFEPELLQFLIRRPKNASQENTVEWLPNAAWQSVCALGEFPDFAKLPQDIHEASSRFMEWFNHTTPETEKLPLDWAGLDKTPFLKLQVLSCLRPDRMTVALYSFIRNALPNGSDFVDCDAELNSLSILGASLDDTDPSIPIYFILSPGTDVMSDLDKQANERGFVKGESYHNVSMGQGQDTIAMAILDTAHKEGHWVILNNVHLMPKWLHALEKKLDTFIEEGSHEKFQLFMTSDPSKGIPIGILNRCIKLTNEPPTGLKANLKRAWCSFPKEMINNDMDKKTKAILFGLCHFHSIMVERKKFGPKGFNMMYPFSLGDLRDSAVCLTNYMEDADSKIPWADLRYIFGQIMYGGHIVDDFDRLLCMSYLTFYLDDALLDEMEMFPFVDEKGVSFKSPSPTTFDRYLQHIDTELKGDTPMAFGLHPNAEIDFRTTQSNNLFRVLDELMPRDAEEGGMQQAPQHIAENKLNDILERFEDDVLFSLEDVEEMLDGQKGPFQNVFMQECDQMNVLVLSILTSLKELNLGFAGELTMSDAMETLMQALFMDQVPTAWAKLAWPSLRPLGSWLQNLMERVSQLQGWVENPLEVPKCTWLSGLSNPQSFLTAIMQQTAQVNKLELDKLIVQTDVTKQNAEAISTRSREGCYIHGLYMEGARWNNDSGMIEKARPREMFCEMPVIACKAINAQQFSGTYMCPVYKTEQRGPTFVFRAQLKTKSPVSKWVLAGVALIMDVVEL